MTISVTLSEIVRPVVEAVPMCSDTTMHLHELAYGCRIYGELTGFDRSLARFCKAVTPQCDPFDDRHTMALFDWLNDWGCRQFSLAHHISIATPSLRSWNKSWLDKLPGPERQIDSLSATELDTLAAAYGDLVDAQAGTRNTTSGVATPVTFGATGASKTLHGIRPLLYPPWDRPFRTNQGYGPGRSDYRMYLERVTEDLAGVASEAALTVSQISGAIDRPDSSPVKLIDEYYWVTITKGVTCPPVDVLMRWCQWARNSGETNGSA